MSSGIIVALIPRLFERYLSIVKNDQLLLAAENKVAEHNNFARRMSVIEEQVKVANHRIEELRRKIDYE